jgi:hypothetical protein
VAQGPCELDCGRRSSSSGAGAHESIANTEAAPLAPRRILQVSWRVLSGDDGGDRAGGELQGGIDQLIGAGHLGL